MKVKQLILNLYCNAWDKSSPQINTDKHRFTWIAFICFNLCSSVEKIFRLGSRAGLFRLSLVCFALVVIGLGVYATRGDAQSGALIPVSIKNEPDPSILSLPVMK